jgi:hypothetical protein
MPRPQRQKGKTITKTAAEKLFCGCPNQRKSVVFAGTVFTSRLRLFAAAYALTLVVLLFAQISKNTGLSGISLKTAQSTIKGLAFFNPDFRHLSHPLQSNAEHQCKSYFIPVEILYTTFTPVSSTFSAKGNKY